MANYLLKYLEVNLKAMSEFRFSFFFDIITMFIVNFAFYGSVLYLAYTNNGLGGLNYEEVLMGITIMQLAFIIGIGFFKGAEQMSYEIISGELDFLLIRPINTYLSILIHRIKLTVVGEIPPLIILLFLNNPANIPFIIIFGMISAVIFNIVTCLFSCIPFFIDLNNDLDFFDLIIGFANYPPGIFNDFMKFFGLFIFPGCMISFGPVLILKNLDFAWVYFGFIAILITAFVVIFNLGLKRYRSAGY